MTVTRKQFFCGILAIILTNLNINQDFYLLWVLVFFVTMIVFTYNSKDDR